MKERAVKARVKTTLQSNGWWWFMPQQGGRGRYGIPDFIACCPATGRLWALECKGAGGRVSPHQQREVTAIRNAGGTAIVVTPENVDAVCAGLGSAACGE